jgi:hypothetical protein
VGLADEAVLERIMVTTVERGLDEPIEVTASGTVAVSSLPAIPHDPLTATDVVSVAKTALTASAATVASVGVANAQAVAANANRKGLMLVNTSANYISIAFGATNAILYSGITLNPGGGAFWMDEYTFSTAAVNAIASGSASALGIQEYA